MNEEMQLTLDIKQCQHWEQLQRIYDQDSEVMNAIHISAMVTHLAQLGVAGRRWEPDTTDADGLSTSDSSSRISPRNSATTTRYSSTSSRRFRVIGSSSTSLPPGATRLMSLLLADVRSRQRQLGARQVANVLWAVAKSGHQPGTEWMASIMSACGSRWADFEPQHLANIAYAMALMGEEPSKRWMQQLMQVGFQVSGAGFRGNHMFC